MGGGGIIIMYDKQKYKLIVFFNDYKLVLWGYI